MADMRTGVERYVLLLLFLGDSVLLLRKKRPVWQENKLNGAGGKIEPGETPRQAAEREAEEEYGLNLAREIRNWRYVATEDGPGYAVHTFTGRLDPAMVALTPELNDVDEKFEWHPVTALPRDVIGNLRWLIPLCLDPRTDVRAEVTVAGEIRHDPTWSAAGRSGGPID